MLLLLTMTGWDITRLERVTDNVTESCVSWDSGIERVRFVQFY